MIKYPIEFVKVWPAGNTTALVTTQLPRSLYATISRQIIDLDQSIEQVGFIEPPSDKRAVCRLQMMGGEFCGNATRSATLYIYKVMKKKYSIDKKNFQLEVSGVKDLINVRIKRNKDVEIELPVNNYTKKVFRDSVDGTLVKLDGIQHFITDFPEYAFGRSELLKLKAHQILARENLLNLSAAGIIFVQKVKSLLKIHPYIWVKDTRTLIHETGCASGSLAVAINAARYVDNATKKLSIVQPSGCKLNTVIDKNNGQLEKAFLSGKVLIREISVRQLVSPVYLPQMFLRRSFITPAIEGARV